LLYRLVDNNEDVQENIYILLSASVILSKIFQK
jgi:hypothetical protein